MSVRPACREASGTGVQQARALTNLPPVVELGYAYDLAGNLRPRLAGGVTTTYTHDAWNRLVKVLVGSNTLLEQEFNGLKWRTAKQSDIYGDYTDASEGTWYHLTDAMLSNVALVTAAGTLAERVTYDPYGRARQCGARLPKELQT